eukprot:604908-Amphidinium_carterae.1
MLDTVAGVAICAPSDREAPASGILRARAGTCRQFLVCQHGFERCGVRPLWYIKDYISDGGQNVIVRRGSKDCRWQCDNVSLHAQCFRAVHHTSPQHTTGIVRCTQVSKTCYDLLRKSRTRLSFHCYDNIYVRTLRITFLETRLETYQACHRPVAISSDIARVATRQSLPCPSLDNGTDIDGRPCRFILRHALGRGLERPNVRRRSSRTGTP